ncbi:hypothetical protein Vwe01_38900 [Micromonospora andamanensis]|nr:hypothetical protein Vwe01_38900 [Micromonospora andamanensis]
MESCLYVTTSRYVAAGTRVASRRRSTDHGWHGVTKLGTAEAGRKAGTGLGNDGPVAFGERGGAVGAA